MMMNLYHNQAIWEQEVLQENMNVIDIDTRETPAEESKPIPKYVKKSHSVSATCSQRRLSLPATDPLHRIFDQMTQPDSDLPRTAHLRRNFSLTDRRRSSLLRGLYTRSSLKPVRGHGRGSSRPSSACLDENSRALQSKENRLPETNSDAENDSLEMSGNVTNMELEKENAFLQIL